MYRGVLLLLVLLFLGSSGCLGVAEPQTDYSEIPLAVSGYSTVLSTHDLPMDAYLEKYDRIYGPIYPPTGADSVTLLFFDNPHLLDPPAFIQMTFLIYGEPYTCILRNSVLDQSRYYGIYQGQLTEDPTTAFTVRLGYGNAISVSIPWKDQRVEMCPVQPERYVSSLPLTEEEVGSFHRLHASYLRTALQTSLESPQRPSPGTPTGSLLVKAVPSDAYVYVDDLLIGYADGVQPWSNIPRGKHMVRIVMAGYGEYIEDVEISDTLTSVFASLKKSRGTAGLVVQSVPLGAVVYVDDAAFFGSVFYPDIHIANIPPGTYTISVQADGYEPFVREKFNVSAGYVHRLTNIRLQKIGSVSDPTDHQVEISYQKI